MTNFSWSFYYNFRNIRSKILKFLEEVVKDVKEILENFYEVRSRLSVSFLSPRQNDFNIRKQFFPEINDSKIRKVPEG